MKMNVASKLAMMYGLADVMNEGNNIYGSALDSMSEGYKQPKKVKQPRQIKKIIPKGCEEFFYGTDSVIARNKKNADKKARKRGFFI
tara:strand:- start:1586 stop:1846 length:261 start_codon:yes stop_codon:yes gene_type:complete